MKLGAESAKAYGCKGENTGSRLMYVEDCGCWKVIGVVCVCTCREMQVNCSVRSTVYVVVGIIQCTAEQCVTQQYIYKNSLN